MKRDLAGFGKEVVLGAPMAAGYALLQNWGFRKMGLGYGTRAAVSTIAGLAVGGGLYYAGAPKAGVAVAITGAAAGIVYGVSEVSTRMFLGSQDSRQALATGSTSTGAGQLPAPRLAAVPGVPMGARVAR